MEFFTLNDGNKIPAVGFGTFQIPADGSTYKAVKKALELGIRHIDTAAAYFNEAEVGQAVKDSGIKRDDVWITSKLWLQHYKYAEAQKGIDISLKKLGTDYMDMYLLHQPYGEVTEAWGALEDAKKAGKIRSIGVSNFKPHHLRALMECGIKPMINQIEFHPGLLQQETRDYCRANDIAVEAYSPLGTGRMLRNETLVSIASRYGKSVSQICLRWCLQHEVIPLPKSADPAHMRQNTEIFDFGISPEDMALIDDLPYIGGSGMDPDTVEW